METLTKVAEKVQQELLDDEAQVLLSPRLLVQEGMFFDEMGPMVLVSILFDAEKEVELWGGGPYTTCPSELAGGTDRLWKNFMSAFEVEGWVHVNYFLGEGVETFAFAKEGSPTVRMVERERDLADLSRLRKELDLSKEERSANWYTDEFLREHISELEARLK